MPNLGCISKVFLREIIISSFKRQYTIPLSLFFLVDIFTLKKGKDRSSSAKLGVGYNYGIGMEMLE